MAYELGIGGHYLPSGDHLYCRCPLHNDRSASFSLNLANGLWFCHAEQRGGTFTQLVMEVLELDTFAAERWIRDNSYVVASMPTIGDLPTEAPPMYDDTMSRYTRAEMPKYWFDRGFTWETADRFDIAYDKEGKRLAIPVRFPVGGPIVGIVYRSVGDPSWKYRNTPDFPKKTVLYGYDPHERPETILLTEGPLDALSAIQAGQTAYATFGAYVTKAQLKLLSGMPAHRYIVAYDNDEAGRKAAENVANYLMTQGLNTKAFVYPANRKDLGECTSEEIARGVGAVRGFSYSDPTNIQPTHERMKH